MKNYMIKSLWNLKHLNNMKELEDRIVALENENKAIILILKELIKHNFLIGNLGTQILIKDEIKDLINSLD